MAAATDTRADMARLDKQCLQIKLAGGQLFQSVETKQTPSQLGNGERESGIFNLIRRASEFIPACVDKVARISPVRFRAHSQVAQLPGVSCKCRPQQYFRLVHADRP